MGSKQSKPISPNTTTEIAANQISKNNDRMTKRMVAKNNDESEENKEGTLSSSMSKPMPNDSIHRNITGSGGGGGGCPMKNKNGSYFGGGWFGRKNEVEEVNNANDSSSSACPVKHSEEKISSNQTNKSQSACPVKHNNDNQVQYNVYSQPIDPTNNMPAVANQLPSAFQAKELPTTRVKSTIPKGSSGGNGDDGESETWTYPSPQMFYNSLARKNKLGDTTEDEIESVVALHNNMNEKTWAKVIQWEEATLGQEDGKKSKLLKFMGRPSDLSPKARIKNLVFGHPLPFDRHDWTVIRNDGTEVRYVIDYYYDETRASETEESAMPAMDDHDAVKSILVDVRPAIDTLQTAFDRAFTMPIARHLHHSTSFEPLPILPTTELKQQVPESQKVWSNIQKNVAETKKRNSPKSMILKQEDIPEDQKQQEQGESQLPNISDAEAKEIALSFANMIGQCRETQKIVDACTDEAECAKASLALTMCLAKVVCPVQQEAVAEALNDEDVDMNDERAVAIYNTKFETALENMAICVSGKSQKAAVARQTHPHLFKDMNM